MRSRERWRFGLHALRRNVIAGLGGHSAARRNVADELVVGFVRESSGAVADLEGQRDIYRRFFGVLREDRIDDRRVLPPPGYERFTIAGGELFLHLLREAIGHHGVEPVLDLLAV